MIRAILAGALAGMIVALALRPDVRNETDGEVAFALTRMAENVLAHREHAI